LDDADADTNDKPEAAEVESVVDEENEECSDEDWHEFEDPDEETMSGKWSCGEKGEYFILQQNDNGVLDGYLKDKETCQIDGKVEGDCVVFNQKWQKGSVHGAGVITSVKGKHSDGMRTMSVKYECTNKKGKKITGENVLYKEPSCDLAGIWCAQDCKQGRFVFKMSRRGVITGFLDSENCCKISGKISAHHIKFKQI